MPVLLLLLVCWPVAEVLVAIKVGESIGALSTLALLVASWPVGIWVLRSRGRAAWKRFALAVSERRPPGREAVDGTLVFLGGGLLIVPGFITDMLGLALLLAPTRALVRRALLKNVASRLVVGVVRATRATQPYDVDSTARDIERPRLRP